VGLWGSRASWLSPAVKARSVFKATAIRPVASAPVRMRRCSSHSCVLQSPDVVGSGSRMVGCWSRSRGRDEQGKSEDDAPGSGERRWRLNGNSMTEQSVYGGV
jgi:hypothetical protein